MTSYLHSLEGCRPEPLSSYLKALGLLRIVGEQLDPEARGAWRAERFVIETTNDRDALLSFLLERYRPTPLLAPWNGGSGFFYKWDPGKREFRKREACDVIEKLAGSTNPRFLPIRDAIQSVRSALYDRTKEIDPGSLSKKELDELLILRRPDGGIGALSKEDRDKLRLLLRATQPDHVIQWLDAAFVLQLEGDVTFPLLGSGGNDGNLDFSITFLGQIVELFPLDEGAELPARTRQLLEDALFSTADPPLEDAAIGQFSPGASGGPNGVQGASAKPLVNQWEMLLMFEGALLFSGSIARRLGSDGGGRATFPFTVTTSVAGGTLAESDAEKSRAEMWLPLWHRLMSAREVSAILSEGRAQTARGQADSGVAFARAIASLGVDRGLTGFQRFAFLQRAGRMYVAAPLGRISVENRPTVRLLDELDRWLTSARRALGNRELPGAIRAAVRLLDERILRFCAAGGAARLADVLAALGDLERALASSPGGQELVRRPLLARGAGWLEALENTPELRIAAALATLQAPPIRCFMEPVVLSGQMVTWTGRNPDVVWMGEDLSANLARILDRRMLFAGGSEGDERRRKNPLWASALEASVADAQAFLQGQLDDARITSYLWALAAMDLREARLSPPILTQAIQPAYALLKLAFLPRGPTEALDQDPIIVDRGLVSALAAGRLHVALTQVIRNLRIRGAVPVGVRRKGAIHPPNFVRTWDRPERLLAALLIPVREVRELAQAVLQDTIHTVSRFQEEVR